MKIKKAMKVNKNLILIFILYYYELSLIKDLNV